MTDSSRIVRLETERIGKLLVTFSSHTTLSLLVYAVYSVTDTYFLSVGIGSLAAAGASIVSPVLITLGGVATIVGAGGASIVSRALGQGDRELASTAIANTFLIFWSIAIVITIVGSLFTKPLVYLLGATENVAPYAIAYGRIIFLGALTSTGFSTIVRADGHARYSAALWIIPICVNIVLSWLFVMVLRLGAGGAALATVIGQSVSAGMSMHFFFLRKSRSYRIVASSFRPRWSIMRAVLSIGLPSFLKSFGSSLVVIVTNNLLKATGGDAALGVFAVVNRLYAAIGTPQTGIVQGMQPIVGYNYGARRFDRVTEAVGRSIGAIVVYGTLACALCLVIPNALIGLLSHEPTIVAEGRRALRLLALSYPVSGVAVMVAAYFQAVGRVRGALVLTLGGILVVRLPALLLGSVLVGLDGIWTSAAVSDLIVCVVALALLRTHSQRMQQVGVDRST